MAETVVEVRDLAKRYGATPVFEHVGLSVAAGEFVAIVGESGVGKSTLLNCIAGLDEWQDGSVILGGADVGALSSDQRALLRRHQLGFVFQAFNILPQLDVAQNVALPLLLLGRHSETAGRVRDMLEAVGLQGLDQRLPRELSGGQLQRVALARALIHSPALLLADEPTGNLDPATAARVLDLLREQARERSAAALLVTHSRSAAERADRVLELCADGMFPVVHAFPTVEPTSPRQP